MVVRGGALRGSRVADGSAQAMESERFEGLSFPATHLPRPQVPPLALAHQVSEPPDDVPIDRRELRGRIPGPEVVAPAAQQRVELRDRLAQVPVTRRPWGQLLHALPHPLHALRRWPALEEVDALALLLP